MNISDYNPCIKVSGDNNALIEKCLFYHNFCEGNGSIIKFWKYTKVIDCTITNNSFINSTKSSIYKYTGGWGSMPPPDYAAIIENTLVTNNLVENIFYHHDTLYPMPQLNHCNHWNNNNISWSGLVADQYGIMGNISEDPIYTDTLNFDYHLEFNSPCIDAGNPESPSDPDGTVADIGYYYYHQYTSNDEYMITNINIFPNPSNGIINFIGFKSYSKYNLKVINSLGHVTRHIKDIHLNNPIDLSELTNGVYYILLSNDRQHISKKLILSK